MFRFHRSINVPYDRQGYIYFKSLQYPNMSEEEKERIRGLCAIAGGGNEQALLEHVTTGESIVSVCYRHYIASPTSLYRALRLYYELFPKDL